MNILITEPSGHCSLSDRHINWYWLFLHQIGKQYTSFCISICQGTESHIVVITGENNVEKIIYNELSTTKRFAEHILRPFKRNLNEMFKNDSGKQTQHWIDRGLDVGNMAEVCISFTTLESHANIYYCLYEFFVYFLLFFKFDFLPLEKLN